MTREDINKFLESSLLEEYLLGYCTPEQEAYVEKLIASDKEIKDKYEELQKDIEKLTELTKVTAPPQLKQRILTEIGKEAKVVSIDRKRNIPLIAASLAVLAFALSSLFLLNENQKQGELLSDLKSEVENLKNLASEEKNQNEINSMYLDFINNPNTSKFVLKGNSKSPDFSTVAYWNEDAQEAMLSLENLPPLQEKRCFQIWADVDGEMLSLGTLPLNQEMVSIKYMQNATSLNVTIEKEGGSDHPDVSNLVANVYI